MARFCDLLRALILGYVQISARESGSDTQSRISTVTRFYRGFRDSCCRDSDLGTAGFAWAVVYEETIRSTRLSASFNMFFLTFRASGPFYEAAGSFRAREGALIDGVGTFIVFVQIFS